MSSGSDDDDQKSDSVCTEDSSTVSSNVKNMRELVFQSGSKVSSPAESSNVKVGVSSGGSKTSIKEKRLKKRRIHETSSESDYTQEKSSKLSYNSTPLSTRYTISKQNMRELVFQSGSKVLSPAESSNIKNCVNSSGGSKTSTRKETSRNLESSSDFSQESDTSRKENHSFNNSSPSAALSTKKEFVSYTNFIYFL